MAGKGYTHAIRMHKLTLQAVPRLYTYLDGIDVALRAELSDVSTYMDADRIAQIVDKLITTKFDHH